jgi:hypothetical protein
VLIVVSPNVLLLDNRSRRRDGGPVGGETVEQLNMQIVAVGAD